MIHPEHIGLQRLPAILVVASILFPLSSTCDQLATTRTLVSVPKLSALTITGDMSNLLTLAQDGTGETAFDAGSTESTTNAVSPETPPAQSLV